MVDHPRLWTPRRRGAADQRPLGAIGGLTLAVLLRFEVKEPYVVLACAVVGILAH